MDKLTGTTINFMNQTATFMGKIEAHLDELNGKVAKHNEWINRYDIRVAEEIPKLSEQVSVNTKYIFAGVVLLTTINIVLKFVF